MIQILFICVFLNKQKNYNSEYPNRILKYTKFNIRKRLYIKKIIKPMRKSTYYMGISLLKILRKDDKWCNQKRDAYCCVTLMNKHEHYLWMLHCFICFIKCRYCTFQISSYYCYKKYTTKCNKQVKSSINIFFLRKKIYKFLLQPHHTERSNEQCDISTLCVN